MRKGVLSFHNRHQPFRRLPNMKSVRLNAAFVEVEMSERLKSTLPPIRSLLTIRSSGFQKKRFTTISKMMFSTRSPASPSWICGVRYHASCRRKRQKKLIKNASTESILKAGPTKSINPISPSIPRSLSPKWTRSTMTRQAGLSFRHLNL